MDVIASTAFGMRLDSHADPNDPFNVMAKKMFEITSTNIPILLWSECWPLINFAIISVNNIKFYYSNCYLVL